MAKKAFKSESKRLMEIMINSIYTEKEIFLRELISNASDALDKAHYLSLTDKKIKFDKDDFLIRITPDVKNRTLTISDNGIGMDKLELEENLGTIAKSGSLAFKLENNMKNKNNIIGQFGVGFYSAFMVASEITVISKKLGSDKAYAWKAVDTDGYIVTEIDKESVGTDIILKIKPNAEDENYDEFLDENRLKTLVKKYSDFIKFPIKMSIKNKDEKEEDETLNSMIPIWRKNKKELKDEDYDNFYYEKHFGYDKPLTVIKTSVEGLTSYDALLYIPSEVPYDFYTKEYEKGLELYSNNVLIMERCSELLPDYFGFVKGLIDSPDVSLNISREMLQKDKQVDFIAKKLKDKIKKELFEMLKENREKYETFFKSFGRIIKYGVYNEWGQNKDFLKDLLLFYSSSEQKYVTLDEYISRIKEEQKCIYYAAGESISKIDKLPQTEFAKDKGYEILYLTEEIDEFVIKTLIKHGDYEFKSVSSDKAEVKDETPDKEKEIFKYMSEILKDKVKYVKASNILKTHPVCITSSGEISVEMEKLLKMMPNSDGIKADKILEINTNHEMYEVIKNSYKKDKEKLKKITNVLYNQALLIEGLNVEDPVEYANDVFDLIK